MSLDLRSTTWRRLGSLLAVAALAVTACGTGGGGGGGGGEGGNSASAPGVTANSVLLGSTQPLTGPAAPGYSEIAPASDAMFKYINSQGGINGRTIQYKYIDDPYNPTKTVDLTKQLVLEDKVFAVFNGLGTPTHTKVLDYLNSSRVPDLFVASGCRCWDDPKKYPYTFGWQPDYVVTGKILGKYIKDNFQGKKVGYLYQNDDFGQDGVQGLDKEIPASMVVDKQPYETSQLSQPGGLSPQLNTLKAKGAQVIAMYTIPGASASAIATAARLSYQPQFVVSDVGSDPVTVGNLLKSVGGTQAMEGLVTDAYLPSYGGQPNDSWIVLFKKIHDQYIPNLPFDGNVEFGMAVAYTFAQALKAAGKNPTRQSLVQAVENNGASWQGPWLVPFRFSKNSHAGFTGGQIAIIKNGVAVLQGSPQTTDDGGGAIKDYTSKPQAPSAGGIIKS
jgi:ABC-type branched-subunit amino acid transport system substrate-binding protein